VTSAVDFLISSGFSAIKRAAPRPPNQSAERRRREPKQSKFEKLLARTDKGISLRPLRGELDALAQKHLADNPLPHSAASVCQAQMRPLSWGRSTDAREEQRRGTLPRHSPAGEYSRGSVTRGLAKMTGSPNVTFVKSQALKFAIMSQCLISDAQSTKKGWRLETSSRQGEPFNNFRLPNNVSNASCTGGLHRQCGLRSLASAPAFLHLEPSVSARPESHEKLAPACEYRSGADLMRRDI
jgi:hypothetical protein